MNHHTQLLEAMATASRAIDRAQAFAYVPSQVAGESGRQQDVLDYGVLFAALVMVRLQLDDAF